MLLLALTIFLSAFLLFQVEPLIARFVLKSSFFRIPRESDTPAH